MWLITVRISALLVVACAAAPARAQAQPPALATVTTLTCTLTAMAAAAWTPGGEAQVESKKADLVLRYSDISVADGTANASSIGGNFFINVRLVVDTLHLLATSSSGPVYITTVFNRPGHPGTFKAVHTRHEFTDISLPGYTSRPEMYVGECAPRQ